MSFRLVPTLVTLNGVTALILHYLTKFNSWLLNCKYVLYCTASSRNTCVCERLAQSFYMKCNRKESNPRPLDHKPDVLTMTLPLHMTVQGQS